MVDKGSKRAVPSALRFGHFDDGFDLVNDGFDHALTSDNGNSVGTTERTTERRNGHPFRGPFSVWKILPEKNGKNLTIVKVG